MGEQLQTISTISALRAALARARLAHQTIGFVPTMGALHPGHMKLVERARAENDIVVASIFVNPLQFGKNEDFSRYPRDLAQDSAMLQAAGVNFLFAPTVDEMYPRPMDTIVDVPKLGLQLEGEKRPGHFAGVATVVAKLFNIAQPDRAYFGEKDYQQLQIIRRMVEDLAQPVEVIGVATMRESDGLAYSSRNAYLNTSERASATILPRAMAFAQQRVTAGERDITRLEREIGDFIEAEPLAKPEIIAIRDPESLERINGIGQRPVLLLLFIRIGDTRLLDNCLLIATEEGNRP